MGRAKRGLVSVVKRWFTVDFKNQNQPTTWKKYKMKYIPKNYVILKTQDMSKKKQNYNETVIFRLYFKVSMSQVYFKSLTLFQVSMSVSRMCFILYVDDFEIKSK